MTQLADANAQRAAEAALERDANAQRAAETALERDAKAQRLAEMTQLADANAQLADANAQLADANAQRADANARRVANLTLLQIKDTQLPAVTAVCSQSASRTTCEKVTWVTAFLPASVLLADAGFPAADEAHLAAFKERWARRNVDFAPRMLPKLKEPENTVTHERWRAFISDLVAVRGPGGCPVAFGEKFQRNTMHTPKSTDRPDIVVLVAREQRPSWLTTAFAIELKRDAAGPNPSLRAALADLLKYMGTQHTALRFETRRAFGIIGDGISMCLVRVDFYSGADSGHVVRVSAPMPLTSVDHDLMVAAAAAEEAAPARRAHLDNVLLQSDPPCDGARVLLQLLSCSERAPFGLPRIEAMAGYINIGPELTLGRLLGEGGFSSVFEAVEADGTTLRALKLVLDEVPQRAIFQSMEAKALAALQAANVSGVPSVVRTLKNASNDVVGLVFADIGVSLADAIQMYLHGRHRGALLAGEPETPGFAARLGPDGVAAFRAWLAAHVLCKMAGVLESAHAQGWLHLDLRPENILVVNLPLLGAVPADPAAAADTIRGAFESAMLYLNDWGACARAGSKTLRTHNAVVGCAPFMSAELLATKPAGAADTFLPAASPKHDWDALALTVLAIALGPAAEHGMGTAPWAIHVDTFFGDRSDVRIVRAAWLDDPKNNVAAAVSAVLQHVPPDVRATLGRCIVDALAEAPQAAAAASAARAAVADNLPLA
jgi:hypothetical protein